MLPPPNIVLVPSLVNRQQTRGPLVGAGRVQQQTPAAGVQMVQESSNQEVVGNSMRFMQAPQMIVQPEGIMDPNIHHGLMEFIPAPGDPNVRTGASPV